jgi:hypothetical protein
MAGELNALLEINLVPSHGCFRYSGAFSGKGSPTAEELRHNAIASTWHTTDFGKRIVRYLLHDIIHDIIYDILLSAGLWGVTGARPQQSEPRGIIQHHY